MHTGICFLTEDGIPTQGDARLQDVLGKFYLFFLSDGAVVRQAYILFTLRQLISYAGSSHNTKPRKADSLR